MQESRRVTEVRAVNSYLALMKASSVVASRVGRHLGEHNLTEGQFSVLVTLLQMGPVNPCILAERQWQSSGNITMIVDNLEKRGLVRRERSAQDRRYITVHLTREGDTLVRKVFADHVQIVTEEMSHIPAHEQEELLRLCSRLTQRDLLKNASVASK